jgi:hypothetical protein
MIFSGESMMRNLTLLLLGLLVQPSLADAFNHGAVERLCVAELLQFHRSYPIPVGCELVDCCPGCTARGALEWRITVDFAGPAGAELRFDRLSPSELSDVRISGHGRREGEFMRLERGTTRIEGLPYGAPRSSVIGHLRPVLGSASEPGGRITVEQFVGPSLVNRFTWVFHIKACLKLPVHPPARLRDVLRVEGLASGEDAIVMLDARTSMGCEDGAPSNLREQVFVSSGRTEFLQNLLSAGTCNSEVAVFSKNHAMALVPGAWTDALGDEQVVTLKPPVNVTLNVWVKDDDTAYNKAVDEVKRTKTLYTENRVGVQFLENVRRYTASTVTDPASVINAAVSDDGVDCHVDQLQGDLYTPDTLNVYYVDKVFRGRNCALQKYRALCADAMTEPPADANVIFIGTGGSSTTMAHEIGHAFGLRPAPCGGHTDGDPDFGDDNIMQGGGGDERTTFSLGQVFRMNTHEDQWGKSTLITNGDPTRPTRACAPDKWDALCPALKVNP